MHTSVCTCHPHPQVELLDGLQHIRVPGQQCYKSPGEAYVEGDASSASYFLAGATITGGTVTVEGCGSESLQGDVRFAEVMGLMGAKVEWAPYSITITGPSREELQGIDHDCNDIPDAAMTLAVVAMFAQGKTAIRNVYNWRVKETERMKVRGSAWHRRYGHCVEMCVATTLVAQAIVTELGKLGVEVEEGHDYCIVTPPAEVRGHSRTCAFHMMNPTQGPKPGVAIDTYDDHRMAMAFALTACGGVPVVINDPKCTRKTFPTYFDVFEGMVKH